MRSFMVGSSLAFLLLVSGVASAIITGMATHHEYSVFSSAGEGFVLSENDLFVTDDAIHKIGYYSVNGGAWQSFNLQGNTYGDSPSWLTGTATASLPGFGAGEHYVIVYSCARASNEWDCHGTPEHPRGFWQLVVVDNVVSCGDVSCAAGEYCHQGVCLLDVPGNTYFVAPGGNDTTGDGSFGNPWGSIYKAISESYAGDITYFRGGVYNLTSTARLKRSGMPDSLIRYYGYPGERPIFDGEHLETVGPEGNRQRYGIAVSYVSNLYFKGLTVRNIKQLEWDDKCMGYSLFNAVNITFEHCVAHDIWARGFHVWNSEYITFINVDSYNNADPLRDTPGNGGTGWTVGAHYEMKGPINFYGCRSWNCSDGGFQGGQRGLSVYENCWSWDHGYYSAGDGHGFKLGWISDDIEPLARKVTNSISVYNARSGFHENSYDGTDPPQYSFNGEWFQNTAYKNGWWGFMGGFTTLGDNENTYSNNIAYDNNQVHQANDAWFQFGHYGSHNTWDTKVQMTDEDFMMLPLTLEEVYAVLGAPRHANGSLPDIGDYFRLAETSEFIDMGMVIPGYHCPTNGSYQGTECVEWSGYAPDPGAFESPFIAQIPYPIDECRTLANPNGTYILTSDVSSTNTCFSFAEDNITLDCDGHTITYGTAGNTNSYGAYIDDHGILMKNCVIVDGNPTSTNGERQGIRLTRASNNRLENNTIATDNQRAIFLYQSSYNTLVGNNATAASQVSIILVDAHHNVLQDNTAQSTTSNALALVIAHNNIITRITATSSGGNDLFVSGSNNNTFTDCNQDIDGVIRIREDGGSQGNMYNNCS